MDLEQTAREKYSLLQTLLRFRATLNASMVPGNYSESHTDLKDYISDTYTNTVKEIQENEWYKQEVSEMERLNKELAEDNEDFDSNLKINMSDIFKVGKTAA